MNRELIMKWIEALRSGLYKQGKGQLRDGDDFCCLGVLCDVKDSSKWTPIANRDSEDAGAAWNGSITAPPIKLQTEAGLLDGSHTCNTLVSMNDALGQSFPEIAAYIEEYILPQAS